MASGSVSGAVSRALQQPGARPGHRAIDDREQAAGNAPFQRRREFQVASGRGVDHHRRAGLRSNATAQAGAARPFWVSFEIAEYGARRRELRPAEGLPRPSREAMP